MLQYGDTVYTLGATGFPVECVVTGVWRSHPLGATVGVRSLVTEQTDTLGLRQVYMTEQEAALAKVMRSPVFYNWIGKGST